MQPLPSPALSTGQSSIRRTTWPLRSPRLRCAHGCHAQLADRAKATLAGKPPVAPPRCALPVGAKVLLHRYLAGVVTGRHRSGAGRQFSHGRRGLRSAPNQRQPSRAQCYGGRSSSQQTVLAAGTRERMKFGCFRGIAASRRTRVLSTAGKPCSGSTVRPRRISGGAK